ncbi:MAG: hypothetical protein PF489_04980 [Salinivirgaceae bacterium]|jgi:hypothetical protein|nr:hypothetical protein [Salinivirgaceae bacterium]
MKIIIRFCIFFNLIISANWAFCQPGKVVSSEKEYKITLDLIEASWDFLDVYIDSIWPEWKNYKETSVFVGAPGHFDLFVNPYKPLPSGFHKLPYELFGKELFYRDSSHLSDSYCGLSLNIDDVYFRLARIEPYSEEMSSKFLSYAQKRFERNNSTLPGLEKHFYSYDNWMKVLIHESFHLYQLKKKPISSLTFPANFTRPNHIVLSFLEGQLLLKALETESDEELKEIVNDFITVRNRRYRYSIFWKENSDNEFEWIEGGATYIDYKVLTYLRKYDLKLRGISADKNHRSAIDLMTYYKIRLDIDSRYFNKYWGKDYRYGLAMILILDRICGNDWKEEILKRNTSLFGLLKKYNGYAVDRENARFKQIKDDYSYSFVLKQVKRYKKDGFIPIDYDY